MNKNYIITKQNPEYVITEKFCHRKVQKVIFINDENFIFFFEKGNNFYISYKNNQNIYRLKETRLTIIIKDIILLKDENLALIDNKNKFYILKKIDNEYLISWSLADINLFVNDLNDKSRFFIMKNKPDIFQLKYYYELKKQYFEKNDKYGNFILYIKRKNLFSINNIFNEINSNIDNSSIKSKHKEKLKNVFKLTKNVNNEFELLLKIDSDLLEFIDYKTINYYNKLKNLKNKKDVIENGQNKDNVIINTNNVIYKLKSLNKIKGEYKEKLDYILSLFNLIKEIRDIYFEYIAINLRFNNAYNFNNSSILF